MISSAFSSPRRARPRTPRRRAGPWAEGRGPPAPRRAPSAAGPWACGRRCRRAAGRGRPRAHAPRAPGRRACRAEAGACPASRASRRRPRPCRPTCSPERGPRRAARGRSGRSGRERRHRRAGGRPARIRRSRRRLGVGRARTAVGGGGLVGQEGQDQPLDAAERGGGVGDLRRQPLRSHLGDQLAGAVRQASRDRRGTGLGAGRVLVEGLENLVGDRAAGQGLVLGPDPLRAAARGR